MMEFDTGSERDARLLIVDDNPEITDILEEVGLEAGYQVKSVHGLAELQSTYPEFYPGVILLDLGLGSGADDNPDATGDEGLEALQYLSEENSKANIIIISGMSRRKRELTQLQGKGLKLRVIGHLAKPFNVDKVEETLISLREKNS